MGIHKGPAVAQSMEGAADKLALSGGDVEVALRRPVFQRVGVFTPTPRRSRGVKQDGIEGFGQGRAKNPAVEVGQSDASFSMPQRLMLACSTFTRLAENSLARMPPALPIRPYLGGFRSPGRRQRPPARCRLSANRGGTGQHRTGFRI